MSNGFLRKKKGGQGSLYMTEHAVLHKPSNCMHAPPPHLVEWHILSPNTLLHFVK